MAARIVSKIILTEGLKFALSFKLLAVILQEVKLVIHCSSPDHNTRKSLVLATERI